LSTEMSKEKRKRVSRDARRARVRKKIRGTGGTPRLCVYRSLNHIYAQLIDDDAGRTLASVSSLRMEMPEAQTAGDAPEGAEGGKEKGKKAAAPEGLKMRRSRAVGSAIAARAAELGISRVVFDRSGFLYHGRIAALAEAARENGLEF
jgi:large subunit ribosomal protein L18